MTQLQPLPYYVRLEKDLCQAQGQSPPLTSSSVPNLVREPLQAGQFPLRQMPTGGIAANRQATGMVWMYTPFTTSDLVTGETMCLHIGAILES